MKTLFKLALTSAAILTSTNAIAAKSPSVGYHVDQCKSQAMAEYEGVKRVKVKNIKKVRGDFKAVLRIAADDGSALFLCTIEPNKAPSIERV